MRIRRQLQLARYGAYAACAGVIFVATRELPMAQAWLVAIVVLGGVQPLLRRANRRIATRAFRRLGTLIVERRHGDAHAHLADLRRVYAGSKGALELLRVHEGSVLMYEGRYAEAIRLLESVDRARLQASAVPWLLNNLAWALARVGVGGRAVEAARESIDANARAGDRATSNDDLRTCQLGTLGAALVVAGKPDEAVEPLEQALARGGTAAQQARRGFYLGEALRALGREDEARAAWKRAAEAAPDDELGAAAGEKLEHAAPPYR